MGIRVKIKQPSEAESFMWAARWFLAGADALARCTAKELTSCVFLAAQSLECALKSFLRHKGITADELKHGFRHNLERLWKKAHEFNLGISSTPSDWCIILNAGHNSPHLMRYPMGGVNITNPVIDTMITELTQIVNDVDVEIRKG